MGTTTTSASDPVDSESSSVTDDDGTRQVVGHVLAEELLTADWTIEAVPSAGPDPTLSSGGGRVPRSTQKRNLADKVAAKLKIGLPDKKRPAQPKPIQQTSGGHGMPSSIHVRSQRGLLLSDDMVVNQTTTDKLLTLLGSDTRTYSMDRDKEFLPFYPVESSGSFFSSIQGAETSSSLSLPTWFAPAPPTLVMGYSCLPDYASSWVATHHQPMLPPEAYPMAFYPRSSGVVHPYHFSGSSQPRISVHPDRQGCLLSNSDRMSVYETQSAFVFEGHSPLPNVPEFACRKPKGCDRKEEKHEEEKNNLGYTDLDVLLGRGGRAASHQGNQRYMALKDKMQKMYNYKNARKSRKTIISQELLAAVKAWGGRFMKLDKATGKWNEVTDREAQKKASQALRKLHIPEERAKKRKK